MYFSPLADSERREALTVAIASSGWRVHLLNVDGDGEVGIPRAYRLS